MNLPLLFGFLHLLSSFYLGAAQPSQTDVGLSLRPSVAILIGIFSVVFSLSFILLIYAKFCHAAEPEIEPQQLDELLGVEGRFSGIDRSVIESLPFFRFSSIKGPKHGLECAVCLSIFQDDEILRLLPKCKHAFHIACVDRWLESHSSCPLCRHKVKSEDAALFKYSTSSRFLFPGGSQSQTPLEEVDEHGIYVERTPGDEKSMKKMENSETPLHKHKHRIILSDAVFKNRWSDLRSSDLLALKSEMLAVVSSRRFTTDASSGSNGNSNLSGGRCASEIVNISRFEEGTNRRSGFGDGYESREERLRRIWEPIAKQTVQLFGGREKRDRRSELFV